jgi:hypothetical protein
MKTRTALFQLLLLTMAASASGQSLPIAPEAQSVRPLNLTLPATLTGDPESVTTRRLPSVAGGSKLDEESGAGRMPYGTGFENRQQGSASGGGGRGAGGQGGKGRGR